MNDQDSDDEDLFLGEDGDDTELRDSDWEYDHADDKVESCHRDIGFFCFFFGKFYHFYSKNR